MTSKCASFIICAFLILNPLIMHATTNPIIEENKLPGTTDWLLYNHDEVQPGGDDRWERLTEVEGFVSHTSIRAGESLTVYVSTDPVQSYKIDFYRMGYYGGKGGRLVHSTEWLDGKRQPTPEDGENMLIECDWEPGYTLSIPGDWVSGVYLGKLQVREPTAEAYVIFIVRDDREADVIFQCSDLTWQSYNRWPAWRSLYDYQGNPWYGGPSHDVGFDRPYGIFLNWLPARYLPITNGSGEFLLWEFPLAFWLEKEGYDVTYISNIDTHADREGLLRGKAWLSVGHDEYWTQQMFDNVSYARDHGVGLAFLSGNSVSGRIYLNPSTEGVPNRVFGMIDRFRNTQELMGTRSYGTGFSDWVVQEPDHWVFEGTGLKKGEGIKDLVGWEYHGQPVGTQESLVVLASALTRHRPYSEIREDPDRAHAAVIYKGPRGNIVFDAGTCWWNMVLSSPPGFQNPPNFDFSEDDPRVQRITMNLLDRMITDDRRP